MVRMLIGAALALVFVQTSAWAGPGPTSPLVGLSSGTGDDEHGDEDAAASPDSAPRPAFAADDSRASSAGAVERSGAASIAAPPTQSVTVDLGGAIVTLGGWAYPRIPFRGESTRALGLFPADGAGGAFKVHYDFVANDLDWRLGVNGALPGYLGAAATVGVRKDVGPWENPRIIARGAGGLEVMVAGGEAGSVFLVPVLVAEGETALEVTVIPDRFTVGAVMELGLRYGLPLGVGFGIGGFLRANLLF